MNGNANDCFWRLDNSWRRATAASSRNIERTSTRLGRAVDVAYVRREISRLINGNAKYAKHIKRVSIRKPQCAVNDRVQRLRGLETTFGGNGLSHAIGLVWFRTGCHAKIHKDQFSTGRRVDLYCFSYTS